MHVDTSRVGLKNHSMKHHRFITWRQVSWLTGLQVSHAFPEK
jgi:hypothetical protein